MCLYERGISLITRSQILFVDEKKTVLENPNTTEVLVSQECLPSRLPEALLEKYFYTSVDTQFDQLNFSSKTTGQYSRNISSRLLRFFTK